MFIDLNPIRGWKAAASRAVSEYVLFFKAEEIFSVLIIKTVLICVFTACCMVPKMVAVRVKEVSMTAFATYRYCFWSWAPVNPGFASYCVRRKLCSRSDSTCVYISFFPLFHHCQDSLVLKNSLITPVSEWKHKRQVFEFPGPLHLSTHREGL